MSIEIEKFRDAPHDLDSLVRDLRANDVHVTWCSDDGLMCRAADKIEALRRVASAVAEHFADTDAPLGELARKALSPEGDKTP